MFISLILLMSKFSNEILYMILDNYEFKNFKDMRKMSLICKLFYVYIQKIIVKVIIKYDKYNNTGFLLIYNDKEVKISESRYYNIQSIFYNWRALHLTKISLDNAYYKSYSIDEIHYVVCKNCYYQKYFKFIYMIDVCDREELNILNIITGKKICIDNMYSRRRKMLNFYGLGKLGVDFVRCQDLKYYCNDLILRKLLLFKYLKNKSLNISNIYDNLFKNFRY